MVGSFVGCCARAANGHATDAPPSAAINSRRPMLTGMCPSLCGCCLVRGRYHAASKRSSRSGGRECRCCAATAMTAQGHLETVGCVRRIAASSRTADSASTMPTRLLRA
jgi:hypothetical protein